MADERNAMLLEECVLNVSLVSRVSLAFLNDHQNDRARNNENLKINEPNEARYEKEINGVNGTMERS